MKKVIFTICIAFLLFGGVASAATLPIGDLSGFFVMIPRISTYNYYMSQDGNDVSMNFLTNFKTEGHVMIVDTDTGIDQMYYEGAESVFHTMSITLPSGNYEMFAVTEGRHGLLTGDVIPFTID